MIKAYRYQLRLKGSQHASFRRWSGALRWLWNQMIAQQQARRARGEGYANYAQMCSTLTVWRNDHATYWLSQAPLHPQQQVLKRLDAAYQRFFKKTGGYPKFKRYGDDPGMRFPDAKQVAYDPINERIKLPKVGWVRLRLSRPIEGTIRNISVRREGERWYASIQTLQGDVAPSKDLQPALGLDLGINVFAAGSDGSMVEPLNAYKLHQCRLRRYQRSVSRKVKGSKNRKKAIERLGMMHRKVARMRSDWLHQITSSLVPFTTLNPEQLMAALPYQFAGKNIGITFHRGWQDHFVRLCFAIDETLGNDKRGFYWSQVKEKWGSLRAYTHLEPTKAGAKYAPVILSEQQPSGAMKQVGRFIDASAVGDLVGKRIAELIDAACEEAAHTCCVCASAAEIKNLGWVACLCDFHERQFLKNRNLLPKYCWSMGGSGHGWRA